MDSTKIKTSALLPQGEKRHTFGGYVSNYRGAVFFDPSLDKWDNPMLGREIECLRNSSVTKDSFQRPKLLTGYECLPRAVVVCSQSGFGSVKPVHRPNFTDILKADRDQLLRSVDPKAQIKSDCMIDRMSESKENFSKFSIKRQEPHVNSPIIGSRDSGFTTNNGGVPNPLDGRHLDPFYVGQTPDWKIGLSVTHEEFMKPDVYLRTGYENMIPISSTASPMSGFNRSRELDPCFARGYAKVDPCKNPFETSYLAEYPWKSYKCPLLGKEVVGKGFQSFVPATINLFTGCETYITETKERFGDPAPIGRARGGHLRGAVNPSAPTAYSRSTDLHSNKWVSPCIPGTSQFGEFYHQDDMPPQRYNPFPRLWLKHKTHLDKNYRPNPISEAVDYDMKGIEPGTSYENFPTPI